MFGRKKGKDAPAQAAKAKGRPPANNLAGMFGLQMPSDESDTELEAELAALEGRPAAKKKKSKPKVMSLQEIEALHTRSSKIGDDDDDDEEIDEDELMAELEGLGSGDDEGGDGDDAAVGSARSPPTIAKKDSPKELRHGRSQQPQPEETFASSRKTSSDPPVAKPRALPTTADRATMGSLDNLQQKGRAEPAADVTAQGSAQYLSQLALLKDRRQQYAQAARQAENETVKKGYARTMMQFDKVIKACTAGQPVDLSQMPPPPPGFSSKASVEATTIVSTESAMSKRLPSQEAAATERATTLPPAVDTASSESAEAKPSSVIPAASTLLEGLQQRLAKYQIAQDAATASGESSKARRHGRICKQYQDAIKACKAKRLFDYSELPCPPGYPPLPGVCSGPSSALSPASSLSSATEAISNPPGVTASSVQSQQTQQATALSGAASHNLSSTCQDSFSAGASSSSLSEGTSAGAARQVESFQPSSPAASLQQSHATPASLTASEAGVAAASAMAVNQTPGSLLEALQQRLAKYEIAEKAAQEAGNSGKARRMGRVAKQFKDAIKACKAKQPFAYEELPTLPGFPPLPLPSSSSVKSAPAPGDSIAAGGLTTHSLDSSIKPTLPSAAAAIPSQPSANDHQTSVLIDRFDEYKNAALAAKKAGRTDEAITLMKQAKMMEPMLRAAESGLPVKLDSLPPSLASKQNEVNPISSLPGQKPARTEEDGAIFERLAEDLRKQIETCTNNGAHYRRVGDLTGAATFQKEASTLQNDLDRLTNSNKYGEPAPRFHYEEREFPLIRCFPELGDGDAEVVIVRCHQLPLPSGYKEHDMHVYLVVTFPYPHDNEPSAKTDVVKHSVNPCFNKSLRFPIDRKSRSLARTIKRHLVKLEVMYVRGFLQSDRSLGVASVPISDLEKSAEVHAVVDLMEGRKACGGKVEARVRFREPLAGQDVEMTKERWLVIDDYINRQSKKLAVAPPRPQPPAAAKSASEPIESLEVLRYEKQRLEKQIAQLNANKQRIPEGVSARHKAASERAADLEAKIRSGGKGFLRTYVSQLQRATAQYQEKAQKLVAAGDKAGAQNALLYKKLMVNEIDRWRKALG